MAGGCGADIMALLPERGTHMTPLSVSLFYSRPSSLDPENYAIKYWVVEARFLKG